MRAACRRGDGYAGGDGDGDGDGDGCDEEGGTGEIEGSEAGARLVVLGC